MLVRGPWTTEYPATAEQQQQQQQAFHQVCTQSYAACCSSRCEDIQCGVGPQSTLQQQQQQQLEVSSQKVVQQKLQQLQQQQLHFAVHLTAESGHRLVDCVLRMQEPAVCMF
jgi:hypothetical protein